MKKVFKYIRYAIYCIALALFIILLAGSCKINPPSELSKIVWNDTLISAFNEKPDSFRVYYSPTFEDAFQINDGMFFLSNVYSIPRAEQWQLTVSCNDSTVKDYAEKIGKNLKADEENFRFTLMDQDDSIYSEYDYMYVHKSNHGYRKIIFDGIPKNTVSKLTLCIYYIGDTEDGSLPAKPIAVLNIYDESENKQLQLYRGDEIESAPNEQAELKHQDKLSEVTENDN